MSKDETCGMQKVTSAYNKLRAEEFSHLRGRFYARFPKSLASDYTLEQEIFLHFDVLQAENKQLEASHEKREKRSSDCIIWHSKELSKVKRDNLRLRGKLEYMKKYSGYLRPDGHPHTHYHGGCIWCDIEQALKEAEKL